MTFAFQKQTSQKYEFTQKNESFFRFFFVFPAFLLKNCVFLYKNTRFVHRCRSQTSPGSPISRITIHDPRPTKNRNKCASNLKQKQIIFKIFYFFPYKDLQLLPPFKSREFSTEMRKFL